MIRRTAQMIPIFAAALLAGASTRAEPPTVDMISQLSISFVDPDTFEEHGVRGPFRVQTSERGEVTLIGHDSRTMRETPLRIRTQHDAVWALLDRGNRTFAVRLY